MTCSNERNTDDKYLPLKSTFPKIYKICVLALYLHKLFHYKIRIDRANADQLGYYRQWNDSIWLWNEKPKQWPCIQVLRCKICKNVIKIANSAGGSGGVGATWLILGDARNICSSGARDAGTVKVLRSRFPPSPWLESLCYLNIPLSKRVIKYILFSPGLLQLLL